MNISSADKKILLDLLKDLSQCYSRAICNDYTLPAAISAEEKSDLQLDVLKFVQSVPDFEDDDPIFAARMVLGNNMLLVHYLINKLENA